MSEIKDLIQYALDQDYNKASEVFGDVMSVKISDLLDQEKVKLAGQIYNGEELEGGGQEYASIDAVDVDDVDIDLSDEEIDAIDLEGDDDESEEDEVSEEEDDEASDDDEK